MIQILSTRGEEAERPFLNVETLIRSSYVLLGLLLVLALFLSVRFRDASRWRASPENLAFEERGKHLSAIRKYVTLGVTSTRDYLVNNHPDNDEVYNQELRRARAGVTREFLSLADWTAKRDALTQLDHDLAEFWGVLDEHRLVTRQDKSEQGFDFLHARVFPLRNEIYTHLGALDSDVEKDWSTTEARLAGARDQDFSYAFHLMGASVVISLIMAAGTHTYRRNYRRECGLKMQEIAFARDSMEQLSGRLLRIQEDERRKISRELHDGIGQTLTALRMEIHGVKFAAGGPLNGGEQRLTRAYKLAEEAVRSVKDISLLLRPPLLDDLGLEPALAWLTDQFSRRTDIRCHVRVDNLQQHLSEDLKTCVFRVIQEALNNCEKHALPTQVEVVVEQKGETLSVCIEDDGAGFALNDNNAPARQAGLGILGMRERASLLGGTLTIRSSPGKGTKLMLVLPVAMVGSQELFPLRAPALKT